MSIHLTLAVGYGFVWMVMAVVVVALHNTPNEEEDASPLIRDPNPGERRIKYWVTQYPRALIWPIPVAILLIKGIPRVLRYLVEPMEGNS